MRSLPLPSPSSAASSPAGAALPAIRTEYAGSTFKPCFAADSDDTVPIKKGLVTKLLSEPVVVPSVHFDLSFVPPSTIDGNDGGFWRRHHEANPGALTEAYERHCRSECLVSFSSGSRGSNAFSRFLKRIANRCSSMAHNAFRAVFAARHLKEAVEARDAASLGFGYEAQRSLLVEPSQSYRHVEVHLPHKGERHVGGNGGFFHVAGGHVASLSVEDRDSQSTNFTTGTSREFVPHAFGSEVHDDDFGLTPEELIADLERDVLLGHVAVALLLLAGAAILALPFAAAFGWF